MANEKRMDCVILGLLSHESMTGYEIKKRMDTTLKFFWGASYGSIYPTLSELVKSGMVDKYETTENGREKAVYTIRDAGREHLKKWLQLPAEKDEIRYETLLKLFFGNEIGKAGTLEHIQNFQEKIQKELPLLEGAVKELERIKDLDETHLYYLLTAMFGVKTYQSYLEWCKEAAEILKKKSSISE
jgi:DNA-binding PadR family transcriptional regulator